MKEDTGIKFAFFDVDGTLSEPRYMVDGQLKIGLFFDRWNAYCLEHKEETYKDCRTIPVVKEHALKRKMCGARLYVLSTSLSEEETRAKKRFIERNYPGIFEEVITVDADDKKIDVILSYASEHGCLPKECELVEDTYRTLLKAMENGICATHISNLISE